MTTRQRIAISAAAVLVLSIMSALSLSASAAPTVFDGATVARPDYAARVDRAVAIVEQTLPVSADPDYQVRTDRSLTSIAEMLPAREQIFVDGRRITVDNRQLQDAVASALAVDSGPERRRFVAEIALRLDMISGSIEAPPAPSGSRRVLRSVMSESVASRPDAITQLSTRIATWLRRTLGNRFNISPGISTPSIPRPPQWLLMSAAVIIILLTSALMLRLILRRVRVVPVDESGLEVSPLNDLPEKDPYDEALALAGQGRQREAVRLLFKSLQYRLDSMRVVRYRRAQTNYEYLDSVRGAGRSLEPPVRTMIGTFERALYGLKDVDPSEYSKYERDYDATMDEAGKLSEEEQ